METSSAARLSMTTTIDTALWPDILAYLRLKHPAVCRHWFEQLQPIDLDGGVLSIHVSNPVHKRYLKTKCAEYFREAAQEATGNLVSVVFVNRDTEEAGWRSSTKPTRPKPAKPSRNGNGQSTSELPSSHEQGVSWSGDDDELPISPDYVFDTFVNGPGNRLAYAASVAVANQPGEAYNPMYIHGGVGLGKTHLLQGICNAMIQTNPGARICYLSCDTFVSQFLDCVQGGMMKEFRHRYRHVDVLVVDDIQFLAGRERTQEEFFHTFNELYHAKKQIVLSSDKPPSEIEHLEDRLISRFQWGLVANITRPDFETRVAIIRSKLKVRGIAMPDDVVNYIASKMDSNARELEGALTTIQATAHHLGGAVTLAMAHEALGDPPPQTRSSQTTLQHIVEHVTDFYRVKLVELQSKKRHKSITEPRQVCMWLARKCTRLSLQEIGAYFGGRDHTTVMHSIRTVDDRLEQDNTFAQQIDHLEGRVAQLA